MYRTALALTIVALMLPATAAAAQEPEPPLEMPPIELCGSTLTIEVLEDGTNERHDETSFAVSGNSVLRISDEDSSVVVHLPGHVSGEATETGGIVTETGHSLLIANPEYPFQAEAIARAGLPELPLIIGRVVITETSDPVTGAGTGYEITSVKGRVIDVCELLAR